LRGFQPPIPEALEELLELREALGPHAVQASLVPSLAHEPRLLENFRCWETAGREASKCDAISPALSSTSPLRPAGVLAFSRMSEERVVPGGDNTT
jgi:hypothetical protein